VAGSAVGVYVVAVLVALGLGTLVQRSDSAFLAVKLIVGIYMLWLGVQAGGKWELIEPIVARTLSAHDIAVTVYDFD
jgi:threonine/homoserine/homoserine lactone efflux protein